MAITRFRRTIRRRSNAGVVKLKTALARARARKRGPDNLTRDLTAMAGSAGLGRLEVMGIVPPTILSLDSALVIGGVGCFIGPKIASGSFGRILHDASLGALCVSGYRLGRGQKLMAGEYEETDSDDALEGGGWTESA